MHYENRVSHFSLEGWPLKLISLQKRNHEPTFSAPGSWEWFAIWSYCGISMSKPTKTLLFQKPILWKRPQNQKPRGWDSSGACREAGLRRAWPFSAEKTQPCGGGGALWLSHSASLNSNKQFPSSNDDIFISSKFNHKSIVILIFFTSVQMASNRQTSF